MEVLVIMELIGLVITVDCLDFLRELMDSSQYFKVFKVILLLNLPILLILSKLYRDFNLI